MPRINSLKNGAFVSLKRYMAANGPIPTSILPTVLRSLWFRMRELSPVERGRVGPVTIEINQSAETRLNLEAAISNGDNEWWIPIEAALQDPQFTLSHDIFQLAALSSWMITARRPKCTTKAKKGIAAIFKNQLYKHANHALASELLLALNNKRPSCYQTVNSFLSRIEEAVGLIGCWRKGVMIKQNTTSQIFDVDDEDNESQITGTDFVMKLIPMSIAKNRRRLARFYLSAKIPMCLKIRGVANVLEVGKDGPFHFAIMDKLDGRSLSETVKANGPYSIVIALNRIEQLSEILKHAHGQGIVHRALQPENVFVGHQGEMVITGWGSSRVNSAQLDLIECGKSAGNPRYSAPEQMTDATNADASSDVFALAGILYFMITGEHPFTTDSRRICFLQKTRSLHWRDFLISRSCPEYMLGLFDRVFRSRKHRLIRETKHFSNVCKRIAAKLADYPNMATTVAAPQKKIVKKKRITVVRQSLLEQRKTLVNALYLHPGRNVG